MEISSGTKECCVCARQLASSRWVKGSNQLRHSGRTVAESLGELLACETQLSWVCFRCYRLVLGLDYHTHQLEKQRVSLLRLYDTRDKAEQQASCVLQEKTIGDGNGGDVNAESGRSAVKQVVNISNISQDQFRSNGYADRQSFDPASSFDVTHKAGSKVVSYPLQSVCDHEYYRNNSQDSLSGKPATILDGDDPLVSSSNETLINLHCGDNSVSDKLILSVTSSGDPCLNQDHENQCGKQDDLATTPSVVPLSQRAAAKRRKTAKKWDDFEYYEDESKITKPEYDKIDTFSSPHQLQPPPRTGKKRCQKCKQEFVTKKAILNHKCCQMKRMEREKVRYKCKGCLRVFLLRREYMKHVNACYKNTPVTCNLCLVKLPSAAYLPRHLAALHQVKSHLNKGDILCELCGRGFSRKEALERHEARVHGKAHGSHQCPLCGNIFPHTSLLAEHLRAHQGYTCPECSKVFSCRSNLTLHRRAHHMRRSAYHCTACNRHWKFHASYIYHMKKFHRSSEYKCPGCRQVVYSEEALHQHSLTCAGQDTTTTQSTGEKTCGGRQQTIGEVVRQTSDTTPDASVMTRCPSASGSLCRRTQLGKETDGFVLVPEIRKTDMYEPQHSFPQGPPTCEIVVEVLEETDADCQYIILVEDATDTHLSISEASMWNTQRQ